MRIATVLPEVTRIEADALFAPLWLAASLGVLLESLVEIDRSPSR